MKRILIFLQLIFVSLSGYTQDARTIQAFKNIITPNQVNGITQQLTISELRKLKPNIIDASKTYISVDKGTEGIWIPDFQDITSVDDSCLTLVTNTNVRLKRKYDGYINAVTMFGMSVNMSDNSIALQKAVNYLKKTGNAGSDGGTIYIPAGYYRFRNPIDITGYNVTILGDGLKTTLGVDSPIEYLFKFDVPNARAEGGGIKNLRIAGNGKMNWAVKLNSWRFWEMINVQTVDNLVGILDAYNDYSTYSESIYIDHCDRKRSSGSNTYYSQYHIRFRAGTTGVIADSFIQNCIFLDAIDKGIILDGTDRVLVNNVCVANNTIIQPIGYYITNSNTPNGDAGKNIIRDCYFEMQAPGGLFSNSFAVVIDSPEGNTKLNRYNLVENLRVTGGCGYVKLRNEGTIPSLQFLCANNKIHDFRGGVSINGYVDIGTNVSDTDITHCANNNRVYRILDNGYRTVINNIQNWNSGSGVVPPVDKTDVGRNVYNPADGRVFLVLRDGTLQQISNHSFSGIATLVNGQATVLDSRIKATSSIILTVQETGNYNGKIRVAQRTVGISFKIQSTDSTDNCTVAYTVNN